ncbi:MAG: hypothetical protein QM229_05340 [Bacillota bacterium]|nr:hypothetical protein [Bacillota bacterium]
MLVTLIATAREQQCTRKGNLYARTESSDSKVEVVAPTPERGGILRHSNYWEYLAPVIECVTANTAPSHK